MADRLKRRYLCAECSEPVEKTGTGLGTWTCKKHPSRTVSVPRDLSAGKEAGRQFRAVPVSVQRHTKVRVEMS